MYNGYFYIFCAWTFQKKVGGGGFRNTSYESCTQCIYTVPHP